MIARGFKPVAWVGAIGMAALGCYMLSLRVASERAELAGLERRIVNTQKSIRSLQTELETRGRVTQLQQWNDEILALSPPSAGQFLESQLMLAQFHMQPRPAIENPAEVRMVAAETPASVAPAAPSGAAPVQRAIAEPRPIPSATVQRASLNAPPGAGDPQPRAQARRAVANAEAGSQSAPQRVRGAAADRTRPTAAQTSPRRAGALLDERTIRDIGAASRNERRGGARD